MKKLEIIRGITLAELVANIILFILFMVLSFGLSGPAISVFGIIAVLHTISMIYHWFLIKTLRRTLVARIIFTVWVIATFAYVFITINGESDEGIMALLVLLISSAAWFLYYVILLLVEFVLLSNQIAFMKVKPQ